MRILLWHGYLLEGTGSNVYTRAVAREWALAGHDVVVFCQDPEPERFDLGGAQVVRPEIGPRLPTFVVDRYEGLEAVLLQDMPAAERERYVGRQRRRAEGASPGRPRLRQPRADGRAGGRGERRALRGQGARLRARVLDARATSSSRRGGRRRCARPRRCSSARATSAASSRRSSGRSSASTRCRPASTSTRSTRARARRRSPRCSRRRGTTRRTRATARSACPTRTTPRRLAEFLHGDAPTVLYFGKLLYNKGVHVLLEALRGIDARTLIVGFGDYRHELERIAPPRTLFTGPLEHRHLVHLLPLVDVAVVPSIFPEAFGMVAAEAAAAGCPPLVARHSGLEEVAEGLEAAYPPEYRHLASFATGDPVDLADELHELLALPADTRRELGEAARGVAVEKWSWAGVASPPSGTLPIGFSLPWVKRRSCPTTS